MVQKVVVTHRGGVMKKVELKSYESGAVRAAGPNWRHTFELEERIAGRIEPNWRHS